MNMTTQLCACLKTTPTPTEYYFMEPCLIKHGNNFTFRMFIGLCIIVIVEELKTNLMSLVIFITLNMCSTCFGH